MGISEIIIAMTRNGAMGITSINAAMGKVLKIRLAQTKITNAYRNNKMMPLIIHCVPL
jgi:hypothetical protein